MKRAARAFAISAVAAIVVAACSGPKAANDQPTIVDVPTASGSRATQPPTPPPSGAECKTDSDCAPAECCHPRTCVPAAKRPTCKDVRCTMECRGGTFDCGGGGCLCQGGKCTAEIRSPR